MEAPLPHRGRARSGSRAVRRGRVRAPTLYGVLSRPLTPALSPIGGEGSMVQRGVYSALDRLDRRLGPDRRRRLDPAPPHTRPAFRAATKDPRHQAAVI